MNREGLSRDSEYESNEDEDGYDEYVEGLVFVGMAFDVSSDISDTFQSIKRACDKVGLDALRMDEIQDSGPIWVQILKTIEEAEFLIFDLTVDRPNVYYELGYAHGVGNNPEDIVLIAKEGEKIAFNVAHLRIIYYKSATDLENKLINRLNSMVKHRHSL